MAEKPAPLKQEESFSQAESTSEVYDDNKPTDFEADKAAVINLFSFAQPHMRALHLAWFSFFMAFTAWFSIAPLNGVIKKALHLKKKHILYANMAGVSSTVVARVFIGPLCDRYGPKTTMTILLVVSAVPLACTGLITNYQGLIAIRTAIGIIGASFVLASTWTTNMFQKRVVGTANAVVGGWGNLGGGFTQVFMVKVLAMMQHMPGVPKADAWRYTFLVPAALLIVTAVITYTLGMDTPRGDIRMLKRTGQAVPVKAATSLKAAIVEPSTWLLALHYAASFGVELVVFNMAADYFHEEFKVDVQKAGEFAALGGVTNIFARAMGGYVSDFWNKRDGMRARLAVQFVLLFAEGALLLWFSYATSYKYACVLLLLFSVFVQAANGSCFAIVPYVSQHAGSVSGLVGAGGNIGGMLFSLMFIFAHFKGTAHGFRIMGYVVLCISLTTALIRPANAPKASELDNTIHPFRPPQAATIKEEEREGGKGFVCGWWGSVCVGVWV